MSQVPGSNIAIGLQFLINKDTEREQFDEMRARIQDSLSQPITVTPQVSPEAAEAAVQQVQDAFSEKPVMVTLTPDALAVREAVEEITAARFGGGGEPTPAFIGAWGGDDANVAVTQSMRDAEAARAAVLTQNSVLIQEQNENYAEMIAQSEENSETGQRLAVAQGELAIAIEEAATYEREVAGSAQGLVDAQRYLASQEEESSSGERDSGASSLLSGIRGFGAIFMIRRAVEAAGQVVKYTEEEAGDMSQQTQAQHSLISNPAAYLNPASREILKMDRDIKTDNEQTEYRMRQMREFATEDEKLQKELDALRISAGSDQTVKQFYDTQQRAVAEEHSISDPRLASKYDPQLQVFLQSMAGPMQAAEDRATIDAAEKEFGSHNHKLSAAEKLDRAAEKLLRVKQLHVVE